METTQVEIAAEMLYQEFLPATDDNFAPPTPESLHRLVSERVAYLLNNDFSRLMASLYQMDVPEEKVQAAFAQHAHIDIPAQLATLIIERELRKAQSRAEQRFS